ncbi:CapA family protein [Microbulbifer sp. SAOS-129_SWC]|uniref:CapA family protein n=1 Tax=Microbulbifer sp. SAOS-129_SWC TaxID=3145235 RepID=UPI003217E836
MQNPTCWRLLLAGDVMTGRGIDQILPGAGDAQIYESYMHSARGYVTLAEERNGPISVPVSVDYPWGEALALMAARNAHCRIVNLETAVTRCDDFWRGKSINYRMHPDNMPTLSAAHIDLCSLANNHVLDWGYGGLAETLQVLRRAGIGTAGAGETLAAAAAPAVFPLGGQRLLLFACGHPSSGVPERWAANGDRAGVYLIGELSTQTVAEIARRIEDSRQPGDIVVISIHWGGNWGYRIPHERRRFAHWLIDAGADLVFGHSSHHPQGAEVYRERAILYGCGDLINDYEGIGGYEEYQAQLRLLYCVDLDRDSGALRRLEMIPFEMRRLRLHKAGSHDRDWLRKTLGRECRRLGAGLRLSEDGESFLLQW